MGFFRLKKKEEEDMMDRRQRRAFRLALILTLNLLLSTTDASNVTTLETTFDCVVDKDVADTICWPKCCFANQAFNVDKNSCEELESNSSFILNYPEVFLLRYWQYLNLLQTIPGAGIT